MELKCYHELECANVQEISNKIYNFLIHKTELLNGKAKFGWNFVDCKSLLLDVNELSLFFKHLKLFPRHAAVTIIETNDHLAMHVDELPVIAKINFPVLNTIGWANRWYINDQIVAELYDMENPIVFNSQIMHSVEKTTAISLPRIVASFTFINEPLKYLK